jgi:hypothetical protein
MQLNGSAHLVDEGWPERNGARRICVRHCRSCTWGLRLDHGANRKLFPRRMDFIILRRVREEAVKYLEQAFELRDPLLVHMQRNPNLA